MRQKLKELCGSISMECRKGDDKEEGDGKHHMDWWDIRIAYKGRSMRFDYFTGVGLRQYVGGKYQRVAPSVDSCMECLLSDMRCGELDFRSFCQELGYEEDSRRARRTWRACQEAGRDVKRLLGDDLQTFMDAEV